ncbi:MAG: sensor histidine kinase [Thermoleophilaceae bacterium]
MTARPRLVHQALVYESADDFAAAATPFLLEGLELGDTLFATTTAANVDALREALGADAGRVELHDTEQWCTHPPDRLAAVRRVVDSVPAGRELRALGEPIWRGSDAVRREWARYESIINLALADAPLRFVCLYDGSLPGEIVRHAHCTHPELAGHGAAAPSAEFVEPDRYVASLDRAKRPVPDAGVHDVAFDGDPHDFRAAVAAVARRLGVGSGRIDDVVLAANEIASNAVVHGSPPIGARAWIDDDEFVCEISDSGRGLRDPLAGWTIPKRANPGGWGLAVARRLCDALDIVPRDDGTDIRLHVSLERVPQPVS